MKFTLLRNSHYFETFWGNSSYDLKPFLLTFLSQWIYVARNYSYQIFLLIRNFHELNPSLFTFLILNTTYAMKKQPASVFGLFLSKKKELRRVDFFFKLVFCFLKSPFSDWLQRSDFLNRSENEQNFLSEPRPWPAHENNLI